MFKGEKFMIKALGVRFREVGKIHYFIYPGEDIKIGDIIIAETMRGQDCGKVMIVKDTVEPLEQFDPAEKIIRKATSEDLESIRLKECEEHEAEMIFKKKIDEHKLKMKLVDVEYIFDRHKLIFYFTSESRVDFRNLVRDLAGIFKIRIELRQVGMRDEAKILRGMGICGQPLCCATFLNDFHSVTVKMAKDQGMSLNPTKLSGACGKLKCCLQYEEENYLQILENMPKLEETVYTSEGIGTVIGYNLIKNEVKVRLENDENNISFKFFKASEIKKYTLDTGEIGE